MHSLRTLSTTACAAVLLPALANALPVGDCHVGAYRLADSSVIDVAPYEDGTLRWRNFDGTSGGLLRHDARLCTDWAAAGPVWFQRDYQTQPSALEGSELDHPVLRLRALLEI